MSTSGERAPLYEMLEAIAANNRHAFHVPGHKQRAAWHHETADERFRRLLELDLTELPDTDDLHHPAGPIAEAQKIAAECFGAEETRFLVGGSTAGNLAMILGTAAPGDLLIMQRNVHRSLFHGLMLADVRAVLLQPDIDETSGLAVIPSADTIAEAIRRYPEAKGVVLGCPNYHGIGMDLHQIAELCHAAGMPLLVDEAHGPHFGFHPSLPPSALQAGADLVVQSAHKMLSAMTMGAMLHMQGSRVNREAVRQALRMVQSSSPSFPLLASLDLARRQLHVEGAAAFEPALTAAKRVLDQLPFTRFEALEPGYNRQSGRYQDPLKLVICDKHRQLTGFQIRDELAARGCAAEMADLRYAVLALGAGSRPADGEALIRALQQLSSEAKTAGSPQQIPAIPQPAAAHAAPIPEPVRISRVLSAIDRIPLEQCEGKLAGEWVIPYPPGVPELYPGERITAEIIERLQHYRRHHACIQGAEDAALATLRVMPEQG